MKRRDFLKAQLATGVGLASGAMVPGVRHLIAAAADDRSDGRTVVLLELTGGNDGLNTVVPFEDDRYRRARPALGIDEGRVHKLDDHVGFAPELSGLARAFKDGQVTIVHGVGMPRPDRSHFVSLDRWHSGEATGHGRATGWLGRALDDLAPDVPLPGLAMGDRALPRIFHGTDRPVASCRSLDDLIPDRQTRRALRSKAMTELDALWGADADRALADATRKLLASLDAVSRHRRKNDGISASPLGRRMADALAIIRSGLDVPAVFIRTGGFDTHARQDSAHPQLLRGVDRALAPFVTALAKDGLLDRVLVVVYSEFGRRVRENASRGTDHGSGGPAFLLGGGLDGGIVGNAPDLSDLDHGDVRATTDFRRVLAQALKHLRHPDPARVLGEFGVPLI